MTIRIFRIDASARRTGSVTRDLNDQVIRKLSENGTPHVTTRDLADPLPHVTEDWITANFTPADERTDEQRDLLSLSDRLVREIEDADILLMGVPIYNFGVPAALKAWVDLIARAGLTFRYTEHGPQGLLTGKRAIITVASGGTETGSNIDFATGYLRHVLGFVGITDVTIVSADQLASHTDASLTKAKTQIEQLPHAA